MSLTSTIRDLHRRKGRERRHLALAEGVRLVEEMVAAGVPCKGVAVAPSLEATTRGAALRATLEARAFAIERVDDRELAGLAATEHPQGVVAVYEPREEPAPAARPPDKPRRTPKIEYRTRRWRPGGEPR